MVSRLTGVPLPTNKAIVGEMAFTHESGIHAPGVLREPSTYEPVPPEMIGRKRRIVLGKHSGSAAVEAALTELHYTPDAEPAEGDPAADQGPRGQGVCASLIPT